MPSPSTPSVGQITSVNCLSKSLSDGWFVDGLPGPLGLVADV